jgi:hypothetical protein
MSFYSAYKQKIVQEIYAACDGFFKIHFTYYSLIRQIGHSKNSQVLDSLAGA